MCSQDIIHYVGCDCRRRSDLVDYCPNGGDPLGRCNQFYEQNVREEGRRGRICDLCERELERSVERLVAQIPVQVSRTTVARQPGPRARWRYPSSGSSSSGSGYEDWQEQGNGGRGLGR